MKTTNSRAIAARILAELCAGKGSLATQLGKHRDLADASLLQETLYGCCRWFNQLEFIIDGLMSKPLKRKDTDLKCLLLVGLYQLRNLSTPHYATLNETVSAAQVLGKGWGKSLINAVLRNYLREADSIEKNLLGQNLSITSSHPEWLIAELATHWPDFAGSILAANNERPPLTLRANLARTSRQDVLSALASASIPATPGTYAASAIYLDQPVPVDAIPGFNEGNLSVQDEASQLIPGLLQLAPGMKVLDACAAPGGKTCHLLESEPLLTGCTALDIDAGRVSRISENLVRLGLKAKLLVADATDVAQWWDKDPFDRILLDAPCSATGVIRRHPDIKLLRTPGNIEQLIQTQQSLLQQLWQCLSPGGLLLYTTCSVLRSENENNIARFLETTPSAKYESIEADWGVECRYGRQFLPTSSGGPDGFYYALLRKI